MPGSKQREGGGRNIIPACKLLACARARGLGAAAVASEADAVLQSADRVRRLGLLIRLRKLYRNLLRADGLLAQAAPVYRPPAELPGMPQ